MGNKNRENKIRRIMEKNNDSDKTFHEKIPNELKTSVEDPIKTVIKRNLDTVNENANIVRKRGAEFKDRIKENCHEIKDKLEEYTTATSTAIQSIWDGRLFKFNDLPEWMKDNEYITDMHRPQIKNILSCLRSIFSIHAETGNIWTHLIGALVFLGLIIYTLSRSSDDFVNPLPEKFVFTTFLACAFLCLSFSTAFHTLGCNTEETCVFCGRLDYTGIAILITGSFLPWVYYSFYCQPQIQYAYIGTIVTLGIICTCISLMKAFALPKYRHLRGILFLVFGMCGIAPCVHSTFFHGVEYSFSKGQMQNLILMGALYCIGVVFFITRFPESYWPGKFNLIFQSHQIFHVLVVSAALVQVYAITVLQDNRLIEGDTCPVETPLAASINTTQSSITV